MSEDRSTMNSTIKGKAYEYASVLALVDLVKHIEPSYIGKHRKEEAHS